MTEFLMSLLFPVIILATAIGHLQLFRLTRRVNRLRSHVNSLAEAHRRMARSMRGLWSRSKDQGTVAEFTAVDGGE